MKKVFLTILITLFAQHTFAQETIKKEHREMIVKFVYGIDSEMFNSKERKFKTVSYNSEDYFSNTLSNEEIETCFNLMSKTAKLEFGDERIYFVANILTALNSEKRTNSIDVWKHENRLFYGNDTLKIKNYQGGGNNIGSDYYQITRNYPLDSEQTDTTKIHGSLVMQVEFLADYNFVSLTKKDIGKKFTLGNETLEIVNIIDNAIVLKGNAEKVNVINFISDNEVAKPLTLLDKGFSMENSFTFASATMYKSNYENIVLKKMSFKEFDRLMTIDKLNEMQHEEQYRVIKNVATIGEKFILYKPIYTTYLLTVNYKQNN
jgi:hypothetical protein